MSEKLTIGGAQLVVNTTPQTESFVPRLVAVLATLFAHFIALILLIIELCSIVPKYLVFLEDGDVMLPAVTLLLIALSDFCSRYCLLIVLFGMIVDGGVVLLLAFVATKKKWLLSTYSHLLLMTMIVLLVWISMALCIPIFGLAQPDAGTANACPQRSAVHGGYAVACESLGSNNVCSQGWTT